MIKVMSKADFMPDFPLVKNGKTEELAGIISIDLRGKHIAFKFSNKLYADAFEERISFVGIAYIRNKEDIIEVF